MKPLWRGGFSYKHEAHVLYAHAYTKRQAWLVFCRRLAEMHDVSLQTVMGLFDGSRDNYEITIEPAKQL